MGFVPEINYLVSCILYLVTEHLDFTIMTKIVAQSASRALGLLIAKDKIFG